MTGTPEFRWQAVGRRKTSVARVYLTPGTGKWDVNGRTLGDYFPRPSLVQHIQQSFTATDTLGAFDVKAHVDGGGQTGQAGALRLAIARALVEADGQHRTKLRANGLLTRDPRAVERKEARPARRPEAFPVQQAVIGISVGRRPRRPLITPRDRQRGVPPGRGPRDLLAR